jgi:hypothetical protein
VLTVVCWKWKPATAYRSTYGPETVNTLARMVRRHYPHPHEFVCVTDDAQGLDADVRVVPLWDTFAQVPNPHGDPRQYPSCYRRLRAFAADAADVFGPRFVSVDLDCVVTGDLTPLWNRPEAFVIWGDTNPRNVYNGSMFLLTAGARRQVFDQFDPATSPRTAMQAGCWGSDQGWISYVLGRGEARWSRGDGVYSFTNEVMKGGVMLPGDARIVFFHGRFDPWMPDVQHRYPWVREYYQ